MYLMNKKNTSRFFQGELLIDVEDKLMRKKYVSSLDIEIVSKFLLTVIFKKHSYDSIHSFSLQQN